jgi:hypothetical protein
MRTLEKFFSLLAVLGFCLGSGFIVLMPMNPILWLVSWGITFALACFVGFRKRETIRYFLFRKGTRYGASLFLLAVMSLGIVLSVNYIGAKYKKRFDLTQTKRHTLGDQTKKILDDLAFPIKIYFFYQPSEDQGRGEALLRRYADSSRKVTTDILPLNSNPLLAKKFGVEKVGEGEQIFVVTRADESKDSKSVTVRGISEEKLTNGILRLVKSQEQTIYFLTGHGERSFLEPQRSDSLSEFKRLIENEVYNVKAFSFDSAPVVPSDASALVIAGPKSQFAPEELKAIEAWVKGGGRLFLAIDIDLEQEGLPKGARQLAEWLSRDYGIKVGENLLVDTTSRLYQMDGQILVAAADSKTHEVTKDFPRTSIQMGFAWHFYFPFAVRLWAVEEPSGELRRDSLVKTSPVAWEESTWKEIKSGVVNLDKGKDFQAEMTLAYAVSSTKKEDSWRLAIFGSSGFITNGAILAKHDKDLALNAINWLANQEAMISIRSVESRDVTLSIDSNLYNFIVLVLMLGIPLSVLGSGAWVWFSRKSK